MPEEDLSAGLINAMDQGTPPAPESGQATDPPSAEQTSTATYSTEGLSPYAQNWLAQLPEGDRPKAAEYVKNWDSGFQSYSQRVQQQLQPYTQLGDPGELAQIKGLVEQLKADPQGFVEQLIEHGFYKPGPSNAQTPPGQQQYYDAEGNPVQLPGQLPPEYDKKIGRLENALGTVAQQMQAQKQQAEEAQAARELDKMITEAKAKHGNFSELYVLTLMQQGQTIDSAVQAWKNELAAHTAPKPAPKVMSASSAPPAVSGPLNSSEERKSALLQYMQTLK